MAHLMLHVLGEPAVYHDGHELRFPTRKTLALLIYLALEEGMHSRETLATLLWPESDTQQGRAALRNTLNYLRHTLDDRATPQLLITRDALGFERTADCTIDVFVLRDAMRALRNGAATTEILTSALSMYRGDFLAGFSVGDAPEFEDWAAHLREHWHQQIHVVCEHLSTQQRAAGELIAAIETLQRWLMINPLHEPAYQQLMQLYLAQGDRDAVRRTYAACRARLAEEFGTEPDPETRMLAAEPAALQSRHIAQTRHDAAGRLEIPLVGREREYMQLIDLYYRAQQTGVQVVSLEGEAGVGKTRLVLEFLTWANDQGADVVRGRAFESGGRLPYQPLVDAWRVRLERENAPEDLLDDVWLTELSRLLPELRERYPDLPVAGSDEPAARSRLYEALARLGLALAGRRPLILLIDDLQWLDEASLDVLPYLVRRWSEAVAPVLVLLNIRVEALHPRRPLAGWLTALERDNRLWRMPLHPLTVEQTHTLIQRISGAHGAAPGGGERSTRFALWLYRESAGLPLFIAEILKSLMERGLISMEQSADEPTALLISPALLDQPGTNTLLPVGVRDIIRARLFQLEPETFSVLVAGAILGQLFTFEQLCRVAEVDETAGLQALDELLARRLLQPAQDEDVQDGDAGYLFSHDKIRDVAYTEAGDARRQLYHRRALAHLEHGSAAAAELAHHALAARQPAAAFRHSVRAGDAAMRLFAVRTAIAQYEQARRLSTGSDLPSHADHTPVKTRAYADQATLRHLATQLGRAYELLSDLAQARTAYEWLLALARDSRQATLECIALNRLATLAAQSDFDLDRSQALLLEAQQVAERSGDTRGLAETEWNLAQLGVYTWEPQTTLTHGTHALDLARELGQPELIARSLNVLALGNANLGQWWQSERHAEEATALFTEQGNRAMEADSLSLWTEALIMSGRAGAGIALGQRALAISRDIDSPWGQVLASIHLTYGLLDTGAYSEALDLARAGVQLARAHEIIPMLPYMLLARGEAERALWLLDEACTTHQEALAADELMPPRPFAAMIYSALCADYGAAGDWEQAYVQARQVLAHLRQSTLYFVLTRWYETAALLQGGEEDLARAHTERFVGSVETATTSEGNQRFQLVAYRCLATLAFWTSNNLEAVTHLQSAEAIAEALELPGEQWSIASQLAAWHAAASEHELARTAHERAAALANRLAQRIDDVSLREQFLAVTIHRSPILARR